MISKITWEGKVKNKAPISLKTNGGYTFEQVMWNRNCSKNPKYWFNIEGTDKYLFRSSVAESWEFTLPNQVNPIRNMKQIYLRFLDSSVFTKPASTFNTFGYYTSATSDTFEFDRFWTTEEDRCLEGFEVDGVRITGRHYFMINYTIMTAMPNGSSGAKVKRIPGFVDFQFYLMHELSWWSLDYPYSTLESFLEWFPLATEDEFEELVLQIGALPKSRRKGLTYIAGNGLVAYDYVHKPDSFTLVGTYTTEMFTVIQTEAVEETLNHIDTHTVWVRASEVLNRKEWFEASFYDTVIKEDGSSVRVKQGYKSSVMYMGFYNNSFKAVGKSVSRIIIEEAGKFDNLESTYPISIEPLIRDGEIKTGSGLILGAAGDMNGGGSIGLSKMAYNPDVYRLAKYDNIYDTGAVGSSCLFIDDLWYSPSKSKTEELLPFCENHEQREYLKGFGTKYVSGVDAQGNSLRLIAKLVWDKKAAPIKSDDIQYVLFRTQQPLELRDAFYVAESITFDPMKARQAKLELAQAREAGKLFEMYGEFVEDSGGKVKFEQNYHSKPIMTYDRSTDRVPGCWVIWETPVLFEGRPIKGRYLAGTDPIAKGFEEQSSDSIHSLASTFIMDAFTGNIVAEYTGRPAKVIEYYRKLLLGLKFYGCQTMYENNIQGLKEHCQVTNQLNLLADEPMLIKSKVWYRGGGASVKGYHTTGEGNAWLREAVATWLDEEVTTGYDENGNPLRGSRYYTIKSPALLDELEMWNTKGNFDRVSALQGLILFYLDSFRRVEKAKSGVGQVKKQNELFEMARKSKIYGAW